MIKDVAAKLLLIPLIGIFIPVAAQLLLYNNCSLYEIVFCNLFFIVVTFFVWQGIVTLTTVIHNDLHIRHKILLKILLLIFCTATFSLFSISLFIEILKRFFADAIRHNDISAYTFSYFALAPVIALSYEIIFLKKEQELESKIVEQLDYERQTAELNVLKNELDPHFIFNSLTTLTPLIATDGAKAQEFTAKLAQAYKYLLLNKDRELITLGEELRFIEDYFFLLQIRHEHKLQLETRLNEEAKHKIMLLPFSLQVLIENAIKHNQFSEEKPLTITISINKQFLQVSNSTYVKKYGVESTNTGLKNLRARYKLTCNQDVTIFHTKDKFIVKLPLIKATV